MPTFSFADPERKPTVGFFIRVVIFAAAIICAGVSTGLFVQKESTLAWQCHIAAIVLFLGAFTPIPKNVFFANKETKNNWAIVCALLIAVLGCALFLRLHQLNQFPYGVFFDEADNANHALRILREADYRPVYAPWTNLPAHFLYGMAWMFEHYGANALALRYTSVAFGVTTVLFAFMLFRRWFGNVVGLSAAFILATLHWHLTFSRLGMHGITAPFFVLLALYWLDRALIQKRSYDWAWLGVVLGLGMCFYTPLRVLPVAFALFMMGMAATYFVRLKGTTPHTKRYLALGAVLALGFGIAVAPFGQYIFRHANEVFARTSEVSITNESKRLAPSFAQALWNQTVQHFLMFNVRGDNNGRQNFPGAPQLDPFTGLLFLVGLGRALFQLKQPRTWLMLLLLVSMNLPGILSLEIEAPHALRSIGTLPVALYFAANSLAWLLNHISKNTVRYGVLLALLAVIGIYNYALFFGQQQNDIRVWYAYNPNETQVAQHTNKRLEQADINVVLSDHFRYQPIAQFLINDLSRVQSWNGEQPLPKLNAQTAIIIVEPNMQAKLKSIQTRCAASTRWADIQSPRDQTTIAHELMLPSSCLPTD